MGRWGKRSGAMMSQGALGGGGAGAVDTTGVWYCVRNSACSCAMQALLTCTARRAAPWLVGPARPHLHPRAVGVHHPSLRPVEVLLPIWGHGGMGGGCAGGQGPCRQQERRQSKSLNAQGVYARCCRDGGSCGGAFTAACIQPPRSSPSVHPPGPAATSSGCASLSGSGWQCSSSASKMSGARSKPSAGCNWETAASRQRMRDASCDGGGGHWAGWGIAGGARSEIAGRAAPVLTRRLPCSLQSPPARSRAPLLRSCPSSRARRAAGRRACIHGGL
jgi:hypothetical protein